MFQLDKIIHVRSSVQSKDSQIEQTEWDIYFNRHAETPKSLQDSKIALSKDSLYKANEKLNTQEVPKYSLIRLMWLLLLPFILLYLSTHSLPTLYHLSTLKRPQDHKQKSTKLMVLQLLQLPDLKAKATPRPPLFHLPRGPSSEHWPRNQCLACSQLEHWKKIVSSKVLWKFFHTNSNAPYLNYKKGPH